MYVQLMMNRATCKPAGARAQVRHDLFIMIYLLLMLCKPLTGCHCLSLYIYDYIYSRTSSGIIMHKGCAQLTEPGLVVEYGTAYWVVMHTWNIAEVSDPAWLADTQPRTGIAGAIVVTGNGKAGLCWSSDWCMQQQQQRKTARQWTKLSCTLASSGSNLLLHRNPSRWTAARMDSCKDAQTH